MESVNRLNFNKIFYHPQRLMELLNNKDCYPIHLDVGFTDYCNNQCIWCYTQYETKNNKRSVAEPKTLLEFLEQAKDKGLKAVTAIGSGEPLFHPKADYLIKEIGKTGLKQGMFTNGTLLGKKNFEAILENLTFLRVSLDSATPETHSKLHRCSENGFQNAIRGLEYLATNRKDKFPTLGIQFVTSQYNINEAIKVVQLAKNIGVDYVSYKPMMKNLLNPEHDKNVLSLDEKLISTFEKLKTFSDDNFQVYIKEEQFKTIIEQKVRKDYDVCLGHAVSPSLYANGTLWLCCNTGGIPIFKLGNIYESSFEEIWNGEQRKKAIKSINLLKCQPTCRLDPLNKILDGLTIEKAEQKIKEAGKPNPEIHPDFI